MATHYDTLGVSKTAAAADVRRAYLRKARALHPDQFVNRPAGERARAERLMKDVNVAWATLGNETKRKVYDADLRLQAAATAPRVRPSGPVAGQQGRAGTRARPTPRREPQTATAEEMELDGFGRVFRFGPLVVILLLFAGIVVATAILSSGSEDGDGPDLRAPLPEAGSEPVGCIDVVPQAVEVPCGTHEAVVWAIIDENEECPADIEDQLRIELVPIYRSGIGGLYCVTLED